MGNYKLTNKKNTKKWEKDQPQEDHQLPEERPAQPQLEALQDLHQREPLQLKIQELPESKELKPLKVPQSQREDQLQDQPREPQNQDQLQDQPKEPQNLREDQLPS